MTVEDVLKAFPKEANKCSATPESDRDWLKLAKIDIFQLADTIFAVSFNFDKKTMKLVSVVLEPNLLLSKPSLFSSLDKILTDKYGLPDGSDPKAFSGLRTKTWMFPTTVIVLFFADTPSGTIDHKVGVSYRMRDTKSDKI